MDENGCILAPNVKHQGLRAAGGCSGKGSEFGQETSLVDPALFIDAVRHGERSLDGTPCCGQAQLVTPGRHTGMESGRGREHEAASGDQPADNVCFNLIDVEVLGARQSLRESEVMEDCFVHLRQSALGIAHIWGG